ncbi:hypothetical protein QBC47DRAFT_379893 [Echria macrotheca]|uniref:DUF1308 domain-containing protein n=1 Tax=Echria macrotheca TaxID=438768 RepID=A0AAJ0FCF3_9PEZI|nr:hypothetical protein QBC47DRAFT_379893 [Echria macrotheca]
MTLTTNDADLSPVEVSPPQENSTPEQAATVGWDGGSQKEVQDAARKLENGLKIQDDDIALQQSIETLIAQWTTCIEELRQLAAAATISIHGLGNLIKVQQRALDKAKQKRERGLLSAANYFGIKSCCWDDRWAVVKKSRGLVCVNKEFPRSPRVSVPPGSGWLAFKDGPFREKPVAVDAVVDSGATWLKFISIPPKTLEYQVMAEGWESEGEQDGDEDEGLGHIEFVDSIKKIVLAARWNHCPHIRLLLPGLREGQSEVVDRVLNYVRNRVGGQDVSITMTCANSPFLVDSPPELSTALSALVGDRDPLVGDDCRRLTSVVNLDPSALTALVTDLHHGPVSLQPAAQQDIIRRSILDHETDNNELVSRQDILETVLFPALRGRKLVCTRFVAQYFRQLICAISTHSEEVRASLILPSEDCARGREELLEEFQKWSNVTIPSDLNLPVQIVDDVNLEDVDGLISETQLPPMSLGVARDLSRLNRSVYLYGWAKGITTITGHRGIERQVQLSVATHWARRSEGENERPPDIWHRHLGGYLIHRDKPKEWRDMIPELAGGGEVPSEVIRWTLPWTTWGRGISTYGVPDTKTWPGVGHDDMHGYGRRMERRERTGKTDDEDGEVEQS